MEKIDFVQTWVDGGDPEWRRQRSAFEATERGIATGDASANGFQERMLMR